MLIPLRLFAVVVAAVGLLLPQMSEPGRTQSDILSAFRELAENAPRLPPLAVTTYFQDPEDQAYIQVCAGVCCQSAGRGTVPRPSDDDEAVTDVCVYVCVCVGNLVVTCCVVGVRCQANMALAEDGYDYESFCGQLFAR